MDTVDKKAVPVVPKENEDDIFILHKHQVQTVSGDFLPVPKCPFGKERQIMDILKDLIQGVSGSGILRGDVGNAEAITMLLGAVFEHLPDKLAKATSILLGKDEEWINNNLESEVMLGLVLPFLWSKRQRIGQLLAPYFGGLVGILGNMIPNTPSTP